MNNKEIAENKLQAKRLTPEWREAIEAVKEKYRGTDKARLIELKYRQGLDVVPICSRLYISQRTFYAWRDEIVNEVIIQAAYRHLIEP